MRIGNGSLVVGSYHVFNGLMNLREYVTSFLRVVVDCRHFVGTGSMSYMSVHNFTLLTGRKLLVTRCTHLG